MTVDRLSRFRGTRESRNKHIADEAINLLKRAVAEEMPATAISANLEALMQRWEARGVSWLRPDQVPYDPDEWLTANELAERADVDAATVRRWHLRGHITAEKGSDKLLYFNVGEVVGYQARRGIGR